MTSILYSDTLKCSSSSHENTKRGNAIVLRTQRAVVSVPALVAGASPVVTVAISVAALVTLLLVAVCPCPPLATGTALILAATVQALDTAQFCEDERMKKEFHMLLILCCSTCLHYRRRKQFSF